MTEMAIYEQKLGNNKKAVEILELARNRNPDALSPRLLLGTYYLRRGQVNIAQIIMDELNKLEPERPDVQMYFGQIKLATGRSSEAVSIFSKLIQIEPNSPDLLTKYGSALRMNGEINSARQTLETAWKLSDSTIAEALVELGKLELGEKNYQEVNIIIEDLRTIFPDQVDSYILEGDLAMRQKKSQEAILAFQRAVQKNDTTSVVLKLFEAYTESGINDKAFDLLDNAARKRPDDLRLGMMIAGVKQKSGDAIAAIDIYQNLLQRYPDNALILNNLAWVYDGSDRKKALSFAEKAYRVTPELPQIIDSYGWFCILDGRLKEGLNLLEIAVKKSPSDPEFRYHLAEALRLTGEKDSARKSLELALASQESFNGRSDAEELLLKLSRENEL
jgi:putative PEP-CTERM system TPR-repeat lipoprotein